MEKYSLNQYYNIYRIAIFYKLEINLFIFYKKIIIISKYLLLTRILYI